MAALLNIYTFLPLAFPGERGMLDGYYIYQCTFLELHITTFQPCLELVKSSLHVLGAITPSRENVLLSTEQHGRLFGLQERGEAYRLPGNCT